jgi:hypothetical protein
MAVKRSGTGVTIGWDVDGGTSYTLIGIVVDGDKTEAKWATAKTSLLADSADTFVKTSYDPGEFKFTVVYDPDDSGYQALEASFKDVNCPPPSWEITFPDQDCTGIGSGSTTETFSAHIVGLSREVKKDNFLMAEVTLKLTGAI